MMKNCNWVLYNKKENIKNISQKFGLTPLTSVVLCNRDIKNENDIKLILSENIDDIYSEKLLPDVDKASKILDNALSENKKIRIVGDYDIDGVCATYILYDSIKNLGGNISYAIPDRIFDGYGINKTIIDKCIDDKIDLIITCDNGIAAGEQIKYASEHGIEVIVTDHHDIGSLPTYASAIIDPKRIDSTIQYPFTGICGAVVAWKFMMRFFDLYAAKYKSGEDKKSILGRYLEFATIATIGDIMPLISENHIITKIGLKKIINTKNKGLKKLLDVTGIDFMSKGVTSYHIGFIIGPLINAAGRMDKATLAMELFISTDGANIDRLASRLKELNDERKKMTDDGFKLAVFEIEKNFINDKVLVVYVKDLCEQVAGIVAGRVKEKYNKPTIILTDTSVEGEAKASCRSIEAYDIFTALNNHSELFLKFGGHKLAAGFSILHNDIDKLRELLNTETSLTESDFIKKVYIDAEFPLTEINEDFINDLSKLEPYGQGFARPVFATRDVKTNIISIFGNDKNVIKISLEKDGKIGKGIIFTDSEIFMERLRENCHIDLLYYPKINEYRGFCNVEINAVDYR